jgi:hypothetical protein
MLEEFLSSEHVLPCPKILEESALSKHGLSSMHGADKSLTLKK